ncbi:TPA: hypothetical protein N0F65_000516 [Lagenidium giganteum]|uniref:NADH-cytochrome b5 reductase n=1 Tax=Lagenidium giganteum TaxID=4803 RepID=A0AAV2YF65_9STRA|nr:TPA: hypothetical protein N0F65_000516 [Lagenidium giganteum]
MCSALRQARVAFRDAAHPVAALSVLGLASASFVAASSGHAECAPSNVALSPAEFRSFKVSKVESLTHNTKRLRLELPSEDHETGLHVASFLLAKATIDGKTVMRPYTPTNLTEEKGFVELVVKGYPSGTMSKHIVELQVGDSLEIKGPIPKFKYEANKYKKVALIAGGSGLTPCLQVAKKICRDGSDNTEVVMIFANQTEEDIILRDEIDAMQYMYPQFKVYYVLSKPSAGWKGYTGHVNKEMLKELLSSPSDDQFIGVCGPPGMMEAVSGNKAPDKTQGELKGLLKDLGFTESQVFKF